MDSVKQMQCKSALHYHNSKWFPYKYDINVYRGCSHRCVYCYARYSHDYIDGGSFFGDIYAKMNIADVLERELKTFDKQTVNLGGVCDSYQRAERDIKLMPKVLKVLAAHDIPIVVSTKSTLVLRDIELLSKMDARVAFTVTTMSETVAKLIEPGASPPKERIDAVRQLSEAGLKTGVHLMPIIPYLTSDMKSLEAVYSAAKDAGAMYVLAGAVNLIGSTRKGFFDSIRQSFPYEYGKINSLFHDKHEYMQYKDRLRHNLSSLANTYKMQGCGELSHPDEAEQLSFL